MKLLVYADGGAPRRRPYASFAAYEVSPSVDWATDEGAHMDLASVTLHAPIAHVAREPLFPKRLSNTAAEAKALRMAVCWAGHYCSEHPEVTEVEFCSDSKNVLDAVTLMGHGWARGIERNELQLIFANIRRNLRNVSRRWTWIPGEWMKRTIINH